MMHVRARHRDANRLVQWGGASFTFDANGNVTADVTGTDAWSADNQLAAIAGPVSASFVYDAQGRRVAQTVGGTTTTSL